MKVAESFRWASQSRLQLVIAVFALSPLIGVIIAESMGYSVATDDLWSVLLGLEDTGGVAGVLGAAGVLAWSWIIAVFYGAALGCRPGVLGPSVLGATLYLTVAMAFTSLLVAGASSLMGGSWPGFLQPILVGASAGLGGLPLLAATALAASRLGRPTSAAIAGVALYVGLGVMVSVSTLAAALAAGLPVGEALSLEDAVASLVPFLSGPRLPVLVYAELSGSAAGHLALSLASTVIGGLLLVRLAWRVGGGGCG